MKNKKLILMAEGTQAVHRLMLENVQDICTLSDIMTLQLAEQLLDSYCYDEPSTPEALMSSDAPIHEGRQSVHDVHVADGLYIHQKALDTVVYDILWDQDSSGVYFESRALPNLPLREQDPSGVDFESAK